MSKTDPPNIKPNESDDSAGLFDALIEINRKAFDLGRYNTAYHALCAALHWAQDERNARQARTILALAREQLKWIDRYAPDYKHSSKSAAVRGHASIFSNLQHTALAAIQMVEHGVRFEDRGRTQPKSQGP